MFQMIRITSISDFLLFLTWDLSQDSYHFNQWFPVLNLRPFTRCMSLQPVIFTAVLNLRSFKRVLLLQLVISPCPELEKFYHVHIKYKDKMPKGGNPKPSIEGLKEKNKKTIIYKTIQMDTSGDELKWPGKVSNFCCISDTSHVTV